MRVRLRSDTYGRLRTFVHRVRATNANPLSPSHDTYHQQCLDRAVLSALQTERWGKDLCANMPHATCPAELRRKSAALQTCVSLAHPPPPTARILPAGPGRPRPPRRPQTLVKDGPETSTRSSDWQRLSASGAVKGALDRAVGVIMQPRNQLKGEK